ncbi:CDP-alcohol phosphatidyltransferase family protein [Zooshikella harenae]|uniref:CDP-alcohol phosphatidyltransferase family protein n=1 Tax=Zooshikella harenae TaxID=2827238 RepID=A0ABS5ZFQ9_9GAMM|nr:CDP-alcohol phosphatidyltransferase family protein [Zooshikella harenae]MBU2712080.1 CDP-alcohol phosphatidyltransferase family protein [Zooshikella harenae]
MDSPHPFFLVRLNAVDWLTLSGVVWISLSIGLMLSGHFALALSCMCLAMLCDAFDGLLARRLKTERPFGRYLDGFVDILDYLVAPMLFLYLLGFSHPFHVIAIITFIAAGIVRLAVFNEIGNVKNAEQSLAYLGLPVFWSVLLLLVVYPLYLWFGNAPFNILALLLLAMSLAMVSRYTFHKFRNAKLMLAVLGGSAFVLLLVDIYQHQTLSTYQQQLTLSTLLLWPLQLILPVVIGGIGHMWSVKRQHLPNLTKPIHSKWFGANKTWRGVVLMSAYTGGAAWLSYPLWTVFNLTPPWDSLTFAVIGCELGLAYTLAELPNSWLKRRCNIPPGGAADQTSSYRWLFIGLDQLDSTLGICLFTGLVLGLPVSTCIIIFIAGPLTALLVKRWLYRKQLKSSQF